MPKYGVLNECDRCGQTIFREKIGSNELDGGFTRYDTFQPYPKGWLFSSYGLFCPTCAPEFKRVITGFFWSYDKVPSEIRNYKTGEENNNDGECVSESSDQDC